jgi:FtsH-binding integral membrane protein
MTFSDYAMASREESAAGLFSRVMGLVALTVGFSALGAWMARGWGGATWFIAWLLALGCLIGLNAANSRGDSSLALGLLFAFGLLLGISSASTINYYAQADPVALRQSLAATALSVAGLGCIGYATRRDLTFMYRTLFWLLLALIVAGIVLIFVHISAAYTAWAIAGLVIFGLYTVVDFNRLRRAGQEEAIPLAASIFIDVFNIFLYFLQLFGRRD